VAALAREASTLDRPANLALLAHVVDFLPVKYAAIARTASYGSWFNYYACELSVKFIDTSSSPPGILGVLLSRFNSINLNDRSPRCKP
jgi:phospholipid/cholesterol/gamma-HCH transport system substrate-binding protein